MNLIKIIKNKRILFCLVVFACVFLCLLPQKANAATADQLKNYAYGSDSYSKYYKAGGNGQVKSSSNLYAQAYYYDKSCASAPMQYCNDGYVRICYKNGTGDHYRDVAKSEGLTNYYGEGITNVTNNYDTQPTYIICGMEFKCTYDGKDCYAYIKFGTMSEVAAGTASGLATSYTDSTGAYEYDMFTIKYDTLITKLAQAYRRAEGTQTQSAAETGMKTKDLKVQATCLMTLFDPLDSATTDIVSNRWNAIGLLATISETSTGSYTVNRNTTSGLKSGADVSTYSCTTLPLIANRAGYKTDHTSNSNTSPGSIKGILWRIYGMEWGQNTQAEFDTAGKFWCITMTIYVPVRTVTLDNQGATTAGTTKYYFKYGQTGTINGATTYYYTNSACTTALANSKITVPTKTGYTFGGYYTGTGGSGTQYINSSGLCVNSLYSSVNRDITLYAKWTPKSYTITYNTNKPSTAASTPTVSPTSQTVTYGAAPGTAAIPTLSYWTFEGWYTAASGGSKLFTASGTAVKSVSGYTDASGKWVRNGGATVYAHWKDSTAPTIKKDGSSTDISGKTKTYGWYADSKTLSFTTSDAGNVNTPTLTLYDNASCIASSELATSTSGTISYNFTVEGSPTYYLRAVDAAGNKATLTLIVKIDKHAPVYDNIYTQTDASGNTYIALSNATDIDAEGTRSAAETTTMSGLAAAPYGFDNGSGTITWQETNKYPVDADHLYSIYLKDAVGHIITCSESYRILSADEIENVVMLEGNNGTIKTIATGGDINEGLYTYKWQYSTNGGSSWSTIPTSKNGTTFSGVTTNSLKITNAQTWLNQVLLRCEIRDNYSIAYSMGIYPKGDVNFDGTADSSDTALITTYIGGDTSTFENDKAMYEAADMNGDNAITTSDKTAIEALTGTEGKSLYARCIVYGVPSVPTVSYQQATSGAYTNGVWTKETVTATITNGTIQGVGVTGLKISTGNEWEDSDTNTKSFTTTGKYDFTARNYNAWYPGNDNDDADSATKNIWIDKTAPIATSTVSSNAYDSSSGKMTYTVWVNGAKDAHSGLNAAAYSFSTEKGIYSWQTENSLKNASADTTYYIYVRDVVGNILPLNESTEYQIPHVTGVSTDDWVLCEGDDGSKTATVANSAAAADNPTTYRWEYLDGTTWRAIPEGVLKKTTFSDTDKATIHLEDAAGVLDHTKFRVVISENGSQIISDLKSDGEWPQIIVVGKPTTPVITAQIANGSAYKGGTWTNSDSVSLAAADSTIVGSGTLSYQKATGTSPSIWTNGSASNATETFTAEGVYQWNARAVSTYKTWTVYSDIAFVQVMIDRTAPVIDSASQDTQPATESMGRTVTVAAHDDASNVGGDTSQIAGLADKPYSFDGGKTWQAEATHTYHENGTYDVWVRDKAGNIAKTTVTIDNLYPDEDQLIIDATDLTGVTFGKVKYQAKNGTVYDYTDSLTVDSTTYNGLAIHFTATPTINHYIKCYATLTGVTFEGVWEDGASIAAKISNSGTVVIDGTMLSGTRKDVVLTLYVKSYEDAACTQLVNTEKKEIVVNIDTVGPTIKYDFDAYTGKLQINVKDDFVGLNNSWYNLRYPSEIDRNQLAVHMDSGTATLTVTNSTANVDVTAYDLLDNLSTKDMNNLTPAKGQESTPGTDPDSDDTGTDPNNYPEGTESWKTRRFYCYLVNGND